LLQSIGARCNPRIRAPLHRALNDKHGGAGRQRETFTGVREPSYSRRDATRIREPRASRRVNASFLPENVRPLERNFGGEGESEESVLRLLTNPGRTLIFKRGGKLRVHLLAVRILHVL
jgi:hypothetical protein